MKSEERVPQVFVLTVISIAFLTFMFVFNLALTSYVTNEPVMVHFDQFGELWPELLLLAGIIGSMPFVLIYLDTTMRNA